MLESMISKCCSKPWMLRCLRIFFILWLIVLSGISQDYDAKLPRTFPFFDVRSVEFVTDSDEEHWKTRGLRSVSVAGCSDVTDKGVQVC